jgi:tetratricopeptide (TPR) repeat protein
MSELSLPCWLKRILYQRRVKVQLHLSQMQIWRQLFCNYPSSGDRRQGCYSRGKDKSALGDKKGAIADYNLAIRINPQYGNAYYNRGLAKSDLGDRKGAIADYQIAAKIFRAQNNMDLYERAMNQIRQLSQQ